MARGTDLNSPPSRDIENMSFCRVFVVFSTKSWGKQIHAKPFALKNVKTLTTRDCKGRAEERRIYKDLISKNNNVDIFNSAGIILQC